ncbi:calcium-dependent phosphotriesterase, partial [Fistulina hepatica ATCC 64428]
FQVFDKEFYTILGDNPTINSVTSDPTFAFAHEAPVWVPETDDVFFASNGGGALGRSNLYHDNQVAKISLTEVADAMGGVARDVNVSHVKIDLPDTVQMTNGGTGPYHGNILFLNEGRGELPSNVVLMNPYEPYNVTVLFDNFFGRQFNSLNDAKIHPSGHIFFTDPAYGYYQYFRDAPGLPNQVYVFDPSNGNIRVVADQLNKPNGIAFTPDFKTAYVADTGAYGGLFVNNQTLPATIYKYDVDPKSLSFLNRRVFAFADTGASDGINLDTNGNVYGGCSDGVHMWNPKGKLLGKFFVGSNTANFAFAGHGRLVILAETEIFLAQIAAEGVNVTYNG